MTGVPVGRYYVAYKAPRDFRLNTNILPVEPIRTEVNSEGVLSYFECPLVGGEGESYYNEAMDSGEWDYGGYCGRSVGCFEVGRRGDLMDKFTDLIQDGDGDDTTKIDVEVLEQNSEQEEESDDDLIVVYPFQNMLDIGLTTSQWPLATQQFANFEIDLMFPENSTEAVVKSLDGSIESDKMLAESETAASVQRSVLESVASMEEFGEVQLEVESVALSSSSESMVEEHEKQSEESGIFSRTRSLRSSSLSSSTLRNLQQESSSSSLNGFTVVTYKFTARGQYSPPPRQQLGEIAEKSINRDSRQLTKTLQERIGDVFIDLQEVNSKHVSVKTYAESVAALDNSGEIRPPLMDVLNAENAEARSSTLARWATVPIILLSVMISGLVGLFFFRRAFRRRRVEHYKDDLKDEKKDNEQDEEEYFEQEMTMDYDDEEVPSRQMGDVMESLIEAADDNAEDVPANMASSGTTEPSSGGDVDSSERSPQRRKPRRSRPRRPGEFASSIKRSLTLQKGDSILSDITDNEERRRRRKKAKEEARRREAESDAGDADESRSSRSSKSGKRSSKRRGDRSSSTRTSDNHRSSRSSRSSRRSHPADVEEE